MARARKNFVMSREQVNTMIEALGMSETWIVHMQNVHPEYWDNYEKLWQEQFQLELKLRMMLNAHINTNIEGR